MVFFQEMLQQGIQETGGFDTRLHPFLQTIEIVTWPFVIVPFLILVRVIIPNIVVIVFVISDKLLCPSSIFGKGR